MPDTGKTLKILAGSALALIGVAGVPLAFLSGNTSRFIWSAVSFFAGVLILGWAAKE